MKQKLTDLTIKGMALPESGDVKVWDTTTAGFGIRLSKGAKSFFVMYGPARRLKTLGSYPQKSLAEARKEALRYLVLLPESTAPVKLSDARKAYLEECEGKNRDSTVRSYRMLLNKLPVKNLADIKRTDIDLTNSHQVMAWRIFMKWCIERGHISKNPFLGVPVSYGQRERTLTDDELKAIWNYDDQPFSDIIKALILTGLRRQEVLHIKPSQDGFTVPAGHAKNGRAHTIPNTPLVARYLPVKYFNGWGKSKARMDKVTGVTGYTLHDIRRTYATNHARIGTPIHVVEALLNHRSGTISGVAAVYIRHNFLKEMTEAALKYEAFVANLVGAEA